MRILLIFPRFKYISGQPPLGIASIYSYLKYKKPDLDIQIFDGTFSKGRSRFFFNIIQKTHFDIIGFSVMNTMVKDTELLANGVRRISPTSKIIVGGPQVTIDPEYFLKLNIADIAIIGEGESTFLELIENEIKPFGIKGTMYIKDKKIFKEPEREMLPDIDKLPITNRKIFDMQSYMDIWNSMDVVRDNLKGTSLIISRGCLYQCSFCQPTLRKIFGNYVRRYSAERVIEELESLKVNFGIDSFMFEDDIFMMDKKWTKNMCELMIERKLNLIWCCNMRADLCDKAILKKMYDAGLRKINIGIESASQEILDKVLKKRITIKQVEVAIKTAKSLGIFIQGYFMIGHPTETRKDIIKTIKFARHLDIDEVSFSITTPLPGTYLYEVDKSLINDSCESYDYYDKSPYKPENLLVKQWELRLLKKYAYFAFYTKMNRFIRQVQHIFSRTGSKKLLYKLARV